MTWAWSRTRSGSRAARSARSGATSAWAFGYNLAALPLAALGFLNPVFASAAMTLSSVFVVWNSLRLGRFRVRVRAAPPAARLVPLRRAKPLDQGRSRAY